MSKINNPQGKNEVSETKEIKNAEYESSIREFLKEYTGDREDLYKAIDINIDHNYIPDIMPKLQSGNYTVQSIELRQGGIAIKIGDPESPNPHKKYFKIYLQAKGFQRVLEIFEAEQKEKVEQSANVTEEVKPDVATGEAIDALMQKFNSTSLDGKASSRRKKAQKQAPSKDVGGVEKIPNQPKDISQEFLSMGFEDFSRFLRTCRKEPSLSIKIDWVDVSTARSLKAFLEDFSAIGKQKRSVTIRATKEQKAQEENVFASGVKWEEVK